MLRVYLYGLLDRRSNTLTAYTLSNVLSIIMVHIFYRDEAQAKMILLKEKADKDLQQHNAEMKEHVRIIDHDKKLRDFMNTKCKERQEDPQLVAWRQRKGKCHHIFHIYIFWSDS